MNNLWIEWFFHNGFTWTLNNPSEPPSTAMQTPVWRTADWEHTLTRNLISKSKWRWTREANWFLFGMCSLSWRLHDWLCWFNLNLIYRFDEGIDFLLFIEHFIRTARLPSPSNWMLLLLNGCVTRNIKRCGISLNGVMLGSLTPFDWSQSHHMTNENMNYDSEPREIHARTHNEIIKRSNVPLPPNGVRCDLTMHDESLRVISFFPPSSSPVFFAT